MCRPCLPEKQRIINKPLLTLLFLVMALTVFVPQGLAHNIFLTAYVEGDQVFVEGGFSDGTPCDYADIEVFDPSGKTLLEGKTDESGRFSFVPQAKTDLKVVLDAGMGHRDAYLLAADELPEGGGRPTVAAGAQPGPGVEAPAPGTLPADSRMTAAEIETIVDKVVQKRLRPLTQLVAKLQRNTRATATQIFGGIGYILGLMGVAMYFKSRTRGAR